MELDKREKKEGESEEERESRNEGKCVSEGWLYIGKGKKG